MSAEAFRRVRVPLAKAAALAAVLFLGGLGAAAPAAALGDWGAGPASATVAPAGKNLTTVVIDDTADGTGVLNRSKLMAGLEEINFNEPTTVAIYTRDGLYEDNINTETLKRAKAQHPEWISASDSDKWADGLFIITLSVERTGGGQIGTYFGEDRKVGDGEAGLAQQRQIQAAGKSNFRISDWTAGVLDVARAAASEMNRPWYKSPALWWPVGLGAGAAGIGAAVYSSVRSNNRARTAAALDSGRASLTCVTMDLDNTEISARALPATGSAHAADLESRFTAFMQRYRELLQEQEALEGASKKEASTGTVRDRAVAYAAGADELDAIDDTIAAAAALYARTEGWRAAWRLQTTPLEDDLDGVPAILREAQNMNFGFFGSGDREAIIDAASATLSAWLPTARSRLQELNTQMEAGSIQVDEALDRLAALRTELSEQLKSFASSQIAAFSKSEREREAMQEEMDTAQSSPRRTRGSILDLTLPRLFWSSISYSSGYSSGVSSVQSSRSSASSGGSTRGYSGGGGSFSGSGSSSRF
ncbi:DUF5129 domain-containing protein [Galactobacter valiniphilus]|uniref:DUF5129 domain-containing protein n=1 Tax=Galactobacter valiniphilus TaxID=2676122 RepID=UPI0037364DFE